MTPGQSNQIVKTLLIKKTKVIDNIDKLNIFLQNNGMTQDKYEIYDFDSKNLPIDNFDYIISLYSLDYHYNFDLYKDYFKRILNENSILIFDTIRPDHFSKLFNEVKVISSAQKNIHSSKRILCQDFNF